MSGPFETAREARELPAVQAIYRAFDADPGIGRMAPHSLRMLNETCAAAGIGLGAFDRRVLTWLAGWEPETCAVVAGLISRVHDAGAVQTGIAPEEAEEEPEPEEYDPGPECDDEGGMSEYRYILPEDYERGQS